MMNWLTKTSLGFKNFTFITSMLGLSLMVGCGGSSDPFNGSTNIPGTGAESTVISMSISSTDVTALTPADVTANVTTDGQAVVGIVVNFSTTLGVLNPASGTALTDSSGIATIQIHPGEIAGAGDITASISSGESERIGFTSAGDGQPVAGKVVALQSSTSSVNAATPATLTATITDNGVAVANDVVTFTSTLGVLDPASGTALTNASGIATITLGAGVVEGAGLVTATTTTGESNVLGFETAGDGSVAGGLAVAISIDNASLTSANSGVITVTVTDNSVVVANALVTFTSTIGVLDPISGTALTNNLGVATMVIAAGTVEGAGVVTATLSTGEVGTVNFQTAGDGTSLGGRQLSIALDSISVTAANPALASATFMEADGITAIVGQVITFTSTLGVLDPISGTALTDGSGVATISLAAGIVEGAGVITAAASTGESANTGFNTLGDGTATGGRALTISTFTNQVSISETPNLPGAITVHFEEADGTNLANEVITFTATLGVLSPLNGTALTDATGDASIVLAAGSTQGAGILTATSSSGEAVSSGFFTEGDGATQGGRTLSMALTTPDTTTTIQQTNLGTFTVTFLEADGVTAVTGQVITFVTTIGNFTPASGTALTNSSGVASVVLNPGDVVGAGVVTASASGGETVAVGFSTLGDGAGSGVAISLALTDTNGVVLSPAQISSTSSGRIEATVTGISQPVIVTFTTDLGNIPIATAITDAGNVATVDIFAANSLGAGTITASLTSGETNTLVFSIGASSLGIGTDTLVGGVPDGNIDVPVGNISAGGTAALSVTIWDTSTNPATVFSDAVDVTFSSSCSNLANPTATIDSPVTTIAGVANSTYLAQGCIDDDIVTATANAGGIVLSATGTVTVNSADAGSILFVSVIPENISLQGAGGTESSTVLFRVLDTNGNAVSNQLVDFSLNTTVGGVSISPSNATTNALGEVQTVVNSGTVHTSVRVRAEVNGSNPLIFSQSNLLVISTGIPDQDSFSLSASEFNTEAWIIDGTQVTITARLADAFNNPVPNGTAVAFTTEGGVIQPSCQTGLLNGDGTVPLEGVCSVIWTSQNPRPDGQVLGDLNDGPTIVIGTKDITRGIDFTANTISFSVAAGGSTDTINLNSSLLSKSSLINAVNLQLTNTTVTAASGFDNFFELISTDNDDITIIDIATGSGITTNDLLGIPDGTAYYNDLVAVIGSSNIVNGFDYTTGTVIFDITTTDGTDTITLNTNLTSSALLVAEINAGITNSSTIAAEASSGAARYVAIVSPTRLNLTIADNSASANSTASTLGITDGTTFPTRTNSSSPQTTNFMGQKYGGRATIVATAIGEESFPDTNGNGVFDLAEQDAFLGNNGEDGLDINGVPYDLDESFVDHNEDGLFNPHETGGETGGELETFGNGDFNSDGVFDTSDGLYNGSLCGDTPAICSASESLHVRGSLVIIMSGSDPHFVTTTPSNGANITISGAGSASAAVTISDLHNQPLPAGTAINFDSNGVGKVIGGPFAWPNHTKNGGISFAVTVKVDSAPTITESAPLTVNVTVGNVTTSYIVATIVNTP